MPFVSTALFGTTLITAGATGALTTATATAGLFGAGGGITAAGAATAAAIAGTGLAVAGQVQAGQAARAAGKFQQQIQEQNALIQAEQAAREELAARSEATIRSERGRRLRAAQRVGFAKAGVSFAGAPLLVFEQTALDVALDVTNTLLGGQQRGAFLRSQAGISILRGRGAARAGRTAFGTGILGAGVSLLSGASTGIARFQRMT